MFGRKQASRRQAGAEAPVSHLRIADTGVLERREQEELRRQAREAAMQFEQDCMNVLRNKYSLLLQRKMRQAQNGNPYEDLLEYDDRRLVAALGKELGPEILEDVFGRLRESGAYGDEQSDKDALDERSNKKDLANLLYKLDQMVRGEVILLDILKQLNSRPESDLARPITEKGNTLADCMSDTLADAPLIFRYDADELAKTSEYVAYDYAHSLMKGDRARSQVYGALVDMCGYPEAHPYKKQVAMTTRLTSRLLDGALPTTGELEALLYTSTQARTVAQKGQSNGELFEEAHLTSSALARYLHVIIEEQIDSNPNIAVVANQIATATLFESIDPDKRVAIPKKPLKETLDNIGQAGVQPVDPPATPSLDEELEFATASFSVKEDRPSTDPASLAVLSSLNSVSAEAFEVRTINPEEAARRLHMDLHIPRAAVAVAVGSAIIVGGATSSAASSRHYSESNIARVVENSSRVDDQIATGRSAQSSESRSNGNGGQQQASNIVQSQRGSEQSTAPAEKIAPVIATESTPVEFTPASEFKVPVAVPVQSNGQANRSERSVPPQTNESTPTEPSAPVAEVAAPVVTITPPVAEGKPSRIEISTEETATSSPVVTVTPGQNGRAGRVEFSPGAPTNSTMSATTGGITPEQRARQEQRQMEFEAQQSTVSALASMLRAKYRETYEERSGDAHAIEFYESQIASRYNDSNTEAKYRAAVANAALYFPQMIDEKSQSITDLLTVPTGDAAQAQAFEAFLAAHVPTLNGVLFKEGDVYTEDQKNTISRLILVADLNAATQETLNQIVIEFTPPAPEPAPVPAPTPEAPAPPEAQINTAEITNQAFRARVADLASQNPDAMDPAVLAEIILQTSAKYPSALFGPTEALGQLWGESRLEPDAESEAGASGIAQFMPGTAAGFNIDPLDPAQAIDGQFRYMIGLENLMAEKFPEVTGQDRLNLMYAAYNAGQGNVIKYGGVPPFRETQGYIERITAVNAKTKDGINAAVAAAQAEATAAAEAARVAAEQAAAEAARIEAEKAAAMPNGIEIKAALRAEAPKTERVPNGESGHLRDDQLEALGGPWGDLKLHPAAAAKFREMSAAFEAVFGRPIGVNNTYRDIEGQIRAKAIYGNGAARVGTSNHGWGLALDLARNSAERTEGTAEHEWLKAHGIEFGWINPNWAQDYDASNGIHEPWHWEFAGSAGQY